MDWSEREFEEFLRQFQPRRPRELPEVILDRRVWLRWLAAAAVTVIVCGATLWILWRPSLQPVNDQVVKPPSTSVEDGVVRAATLGRLTRLGDLEELDSTLTDASRNLLPHVERSDSTLNALAKE